MKRLIFLAVVLCAATAWFFLTYSAYVGGYFIRTSDCKIKSEITKIYFPEYKGAETLGRDQLIKNYANLAVLKNHGITISNLELEKEMARIDKNTRAREQLDKIKDLFKGDTKAYMRVVVLPTLVDSRIYNLFLDNSDVQKETFEKAEKFISLVTANSEAFKAEAEKQDMLVREITVSLKKGVIWDKLQKVDKLYEDNREARAWVDSFLNRMKPGEIVDKPLNYDETWVIPRLIKKINSGEYLVEVAILRKPDFSQWLEKEKTKVTVVRF